MVGDAEGVAFLQWALPRLQMRWPGFRKVRRQVRKRIRRRMIELGLRRLEDYRAYLEATPAEWTILDAMCRITISRFYRDRSVFDHLRDAVLPELARRALVRDEQSIDCWSAGCAAGEEPYTLSLIWGLALQPTFPGIGLSVLATDSDAAILERARRGCYRQSSLFDLPTDWRQQGFDRSGDELCLKDSFRGAVTFAEQDLRHDWPERDFDLVLCRNLVVTYFDQPLQSEMIQRMANRICPGGYLVIGKHEVLPADTLDLFESVPHLQIFRRRG